MLDVTRVIWLAAGLPRACCKTDKIYKWIVFLAGDGLLEVQWMGTSPFSRPLNHSPVILTNNALPYFALDKKH